MSCCGRTQTITSVKYKIKEAALTVANVVAGAVGSGQIVAQTALIERRVAVCKGCGNLQGVRCSVCGCFIQLKAGLQSASCPLKKW